MRPRVLLLDDEPALRRVLSRMLSQDCDVVAVATAAAALAIVERGDDFDVILCDVSLPDASGAAFLASLERLRPELARRVVFVTGATSLPASLAFLRSIPNPHVTKPFARGELQDLVSAMLQPPSRQESN